MLVLIFKGQINDLMICYLMKTLLKWSFVEVAEASSQFWCRLLVFSTAGGPRSITD